MMPTMANTTSTAISQKHAVPQRRLGAMATTLFVLSRYLLKRAASHSRDHINETKTEDRYRQWRKQQLQQQLTDHFDVAQLRDQDILDFGCGTGELARMLAGHGANSVTGVDISAEAIAKATQHESEGNSQPISSPTFVHANNHKCIPNEDNAIDLICSFDVLEHIPDVETACQQWYRILRRDGRIWIWWSPWRGPFGHHLASLIPIPWIHLFLPQKLIFSVCAAIYDDSAFIPRMWDIDPSTNRTKPNKWHDVQTFEPFLNRLTKRSFDQCVRKVGLKIARCDTHGFRGTISRPLSALLRHIPVLGDGFVSYYVYELVKP